MSTLPKITDIIHVRSCVVEGVFQQPHECFTTLDCLHNDAQGDHKTYNRFHHPQKTSPDILKLHAAMNRAVLDAYGWTDVPTDGEFIPDFTEEDDDGNEIPKNIRYRWPDTIRDASSPSTPNAHNKKPSTAPPPKRPQRKRDTLPKRNQNPAAKK